MPVGEETGFASTADPVDQVGVEVRPGVVDQQPDGLGDWACGTIPCVSPVLVASGLVLHRNPAVRLGWTDRSAMEY